MEPLADGRIYTGRQAKEARLVDELGDLDDAIHIAADIAGMEGEPKVVEPRKRFSFRDIIESRWASVFPKLELDTGVKPEIPDGVLSGRSTRVTMMQQVAARKPTSPGEGR